MHTVVRVREPRRTDEVQGVSGSTRLEAKRQRRRDGREQRRTRPPILSESEFLARREAVDRVMVVRQKPDRTQIAVLEDGVLVEHYVSRSTSGTMVGNVYLGKVQNVLPSMEAAFVDVGRGRNAVLYAGEVNWDATGLEGRARSIEQALRSGDSVLVQVTKDPIGHKGARLSSHIALSGRHLVYVPNGNASGISRKLPDTERKRLRDVLKKLVPDGAGVIVRTAAEGASEDELARDVKRLQAQWEDIQAKAAEGHAPAALSEEPDLVIRVVRDLFNEDFRELVIQGEQAYGEVENYLNSVSPDLVERLHRHTGTADVFADKRIDEQILKALDRKVFLPSGGHLVIDRTEAMTVVDVNTGKYTGAGGNLEETVTRNNLEAAEEIVRQLRLRDLGGIVVIDFIDMVLESNRELVLRRLTECLGRDRTKHQVTEITSLGLVQMTRKRIGAGLLEAFSETCDHCKGRGVLIHTEPVPEKRAPGAANQVKAVAAADAYRAAAGQPAGRRRRRGGEPAPVEAGRSPRRTWPTADVGRGGPGGGRRRGAAAGHRLGHRRVDGARADQRRRRRRLRHQRIRPVPVRRQRHERRRADAAGRRGRPGRGGRRRGRRRAGGRRCGRPPPVAPRWHPAAYPPLRLSGTGGTVKKVNYRAARRHRCRLLFGSPIRRHEESDPDATTARRRCRPVRRRSCSPPAVPPTRARPGATPAARTRRSAAPGSRARSRMPRPADAAAGDAALAGNTEAICDQAAKTSGDFAATFAAGPQAADRRASSSRTRPQVAEGRAEDRPGRGELLVRADRHVEAGRRPDGQEGAGRHGQAGHRAQGRRLRKIDETKLTKLRATLDKACGSELDRPGLGLGAADEVGFLTALFVRHVPVRMCRAGSCDCQPGTRVTIRQQRLHALRKSQGVRVRCTRSSRPAASSTRLPRAT